MVSKQLERWMNYAQREESLGMGYEAQQLMYLLKVEELLAGYRTAALSSPCLES